MVQAPEKPGTMGFDSTFLDIGSNLEKMVIPTPNITKPSTLENTVDSTYPSWGADYEETVRGVHEAWLDGNSMKQMAEELGVTYYRMRKMMNFARNELGLRDKKPNQEDIVNLRNIYNNQEEYVSLADVKTKFMEVSGGWRITDGMMVKMFKNVTPKEMAELYLSSVQHMPSHAEKVGDALIEAVTSQYETITRRMKHYKSMGSRYDADALSKELKDAPNAFTYQMTELEKLGFTGDVAKLVHSKLRQAQASYKGESWIIEHEHPEEHQNLISRLMSKIGSILTFYKRPQQQVQEVYSPS